MGTDQTKVAKAPSLLRLVSHPSQPTRSRTLENDESREEPGRTGAGGSMEKDQAAGEGGGCRRQPWSCGVNAGKVLDLPLLKSQNPGQGQGARGAARADALRQKQLGFGLRHRQGQ